MDETMRSSVMRRSLRATQVGQVAIGGGSPVVVQSMTDTDTVDIAATVKQVAELANAGSELVRITVNTEAAASAVPEIYERLLAIGVDVPLVGDFHFNGHRLLARNRSCAAALAKWRVNPGNLGSKDRHDAHFSKIIELACEMDKPIRIGVNCGSLDRDLLAKKLDENASLAKPRTLREVIQTTAVASALLSAAYARKIGLPADNIVLSCKTSDVLGLHDIYRRLRASCSYPLHLGLTEAGMGLRGIVASTAALSPLLCEGIGDTIRISLTPEPGAGRSREVEVAKEILQSLGLRSFSPTIISCPGCGRTSSDDFRKLALEVSSYVDSEMSNWKKERPGVEKLTVAVMGCVVNGPGESKFADIGISLPGTGERPTAQVYEDGVKTALLEGNDIGGSFKAMIADYVNRHYRETIN